MSRNPFIRYRAFLDSYRLARSRGWSDADFVARVSELDQAVAAVSGNGFTITPFAECHDLARQLDLPNRVWVKDDTHNVGGSHKGRHLFGVMLHQLVTPGAAGGELAIASCGNAAVAAAIVARAVERPLRVFIPTWADPLVVARLEELHARIEVCERRAGEVGDPAFLRFTEAIDAGAVPFSVQGTVTATTIDGGRTLGWELAEQIGERSITGPVRLPLQIGGGAMAASVAGGLADGVRRGLADVHPIYHPVQSEACAPLVRAWDRLMRIDGGIDHRLGEARRQPDRFMWAWEDVGVSAASGILDDVTYDWLPVVDATMRSGGFAVVVSEGQIVEANRRAKRGTGVAVSPTGSAGVAALLTEAVRDALDPADQIVVIFTGSA